MQRPVLQVKLQACYGSQKVLHDVSFEVQPGEALGLVGTSGAGKSTLVLSLFGLLPWRGGKVTGEVVLDGHNLLQMREKQARKLRGKKIALVPQSPISALNSAVSLRSHFEEAWRAHDTRGRTALNARMEDLLREVHLPTDRAFLAKRPSQISVGQAQRIMIAMALLHRPAVLVADEPTSALDPITQAEIVKLLRRVNHDHGTALLYISHDLLSVLQLADRLAVLHAGVIAECLPVEALEEQATHEQTRSLLRSLPVPLSALLAGKSARPSHVVMGGETHSSAAPQLTYA